MPFTDSFLLSTTSDLGSEWGGNFYNQWKSDLSDTARDTVLYLGSVKEAPDARVLKNGVTPGIGQITLSIVDIMPRWIASTLYTLNQTRQPTVDNLYKYRVATAGTSGSSEPTWPTTLNATVTDGTVVWVCIGKKHPVSEIVLALTSGALATNTPGASLNLGTAINSGVSNAVPIYIRKNNTINTLGTNATRNDLALSFNLVQEFVS